MGREGSGREDFRREEFRMEGLEREDMFRVLRYKLRQAMVEFVRA